jgi:alkyl hydroperoxide reductase subunit F
MKELVIIGAGPAGLSAALYAARMKMDFLILSKDTGGQMAWSSDVDNYIGVRKTTGYELTKLFTEHIRSYGVSITEKEATKIEKKGRGFAVRTADGEYETKTVVIASGKRPRKLKAKNADKFERKGISYCATCDAPLYHEKAVAVVGGGNSALDAAMQLDRYAGKIYLIVRGDKIKGEKYLMEKVASLGKVETLYNAEVEEFTGDVMVEGIVVKQKSGEKKKLMVSGVFVEIGHETNSEIAEFVDKDERGEIMVDCECKTSEEGVFAAGDVSAGGAKQVISAAGEGATAVISAYRYLGKKG